MAPARNEIIKVDRKIMERAFELWREDAAANNWQDRTTDGAEDVDTLLEYVGKAVAEDW